MNALELLKTDHQKVKELFKKAEGANAERQKQLFEQIKKELETHTHIEEMIFYPAVRQTEELEKMVLESLEEHKQVKTLLREMENLTSDSEKFEPKLKVLMENVEHHAEEEEDVTDTGRHESLFSGSSGAGLVIPETDQQIAAKAVSNKHPTLGRIDLAPTPSVISASLIPAGS